jgi:hypothetical protein
MTWLFDIGRASYGASKLESSVTVRPDADVPRGDRLILSRVESRFKLAARRSQGFGLLRLMTWSKLVGLQFWYGLSLDC